MMGGRLIAVGGAHLDRRGMLASPFQAGVSNPLSFREDVGGGAFNALRCARMRGVAGSLISLRGGDAAGERVAQMAVEAGIEDLSTTFLDRATPSYTAVLEPSGELVAGFADMALYDLAFPKLLRRRALRDALRDADAVLCDANLPSSALERLVSATDAPLYAIGVSPAKVTRLRSTASRLSCLFVSASEASALTGRDLAASPAGLLDAFAGQGFETAVVTDGPRPIHAIHDGVHWLLSPPDLPQMNDVTGAGDALAGAAVAALMAGKPFETALREGVAAASLAVESDHTVPDLADQAFAARLEQIRPPRRLQSA